MSVEESIVRLEEQVAGFRMAFELYCKEADKLQEERAKRLQEQLTKAENTLEIRLEHMNEFRSQINQERATYVTNEKLDMRIKPLERMFWGLSAALGVVVFLLIPLLAIWVAWVK